MDNKVVKYQTCKTVSDKNDANIAIIERIKSGNISAFKELLSANEGFVRYIASHYYSFVCDLNYIDFEDLIQSGYIGIYRAVEKFDLQCGNKFLSYAAYYIKKEIRAALHIWRSIPNPADKALSLDAPLIDGSGTVLSDIISDDKQLDWSEVGTEGQWEALHVSVGKIKNSNIRGALLAYFWIGKSCEQIAKNYGVASSTIYGRIRSGLSLLRNDNALYELAAEIGIVHRREELI